MKTIINFSHSKKSLIYPASNISSSKSKSGSYFESKSSSDSETINPSHKSINVEIPVSPPLAPSGNTSEFDLETRNPEYEKSNPQNKLPSASVSHAPSEMTTDFDFNTQTLESERNNRHQSNVKTCASSSCAPPKISSDFDLRTKNFESETVNTRRECTSRRSTTPIETPRSRRNSDSDTQTHDPGTINPQLSSGRLTASEYVEKAITSKKNFQTTPEDPEMICLDENMKIRKDVWDLMLLKDGSKFVRNLKDHMWPGKLAAKYFDRNDKRINKNRIPGVTRTPLSPKKIQILYDGHHYKLANHGKLSGGKLRLKLNDAGKFITNKINDEVTKFLKRK